MSKFALRVSEPGQPDRWATPFMGVTDDLSAAITDQDMDRGHLAVMGDEMEDNFPQYAVRLAELP